MASLFIHEDDELCAKYPQLRATYLDHVYLKPGYTAANAKDGTWILGKPSVHRVPVNGLMSPYKVEAILKTCTPCHCSRCVQALLREDM